MEPVIIENQLPIQSESLPTDSPSQEEVIVDIKVAPVNSTEENQPNTVEVVEISTVSTTENDKTTPAQVEEGSAEENKEAEGENQAKKTKQKPTGEKKELDPAKMKNLMTHIKAIMGMQYMRNDGVPAEILPGFYLGSIGAAFNRKVLQEASVGHILCCCDNVKEAFPNVFKYRMLKLLDRADEDITRYFDETAEYIHEILSKGEKVLVHCFAGKSRSTTIMISYLIKYHKMTVNQALQTIREKRPVAQPNMGFLKQLRLYEKKILQESNVPEVQTESSA
jgi:protein phosphatase slingshot